MFKNIKYLFSFNDDSCSEQEVISSIEQGISFRGAKLWILIIAIFVASLGLNTNSAAVIIGAMLISPLMGPIIGMGLGAGINDFELTRRSFRNYIVATLFSILTATIYFFISPFKETQSELLARTSPTIYDVLIALCGGLAGIIALSSRSQRSGNVIPGVAIATALMPPLCTVGFGLATANWAFAAGAFYLYFINTIFIAFATLIGTRFIMNFHKKNYVDHALETRVKRYIYGIVIVTMVPALLLTMGMLRRNYFEQNVAQFIRHEMNYPMTQVISHTPDFEKRTFSVVLIGQELDSATLRIARERMPLYKLDGIDMNVIQGMQNASRPAATDPYLNELLLADSKQLSHAEGVIAQQQVSISELERRLKMHEELADLSPRLLQELQLLFPQVQHITLARGTTALTDSCYTQHMAIIKLTETLSADEQERLSAWITTRSGQEQIRVMFE